MSPHTRSSRLAKKAGIEHKVGCHALRHANYIVAAFIAGAA
jgi:site-specific recombinase XerD